jgi:hypothetical protein
MNMLARITVLSSAAVVLMTSGCSKSTDTPTAAVSETYDAIQKGDVDAVWQRMSQADRSKFTSALGVAEESEGTQALTEALAKQVFHRFTIAEAKRKGDAATVTVTAFKTDDDADGETRTIKLIKENGKWVLNDN